MNLADLIIQSLASDDSSFHEQLMKIVSSYPLPEVEEAITEIVEGGNNLNSEQRLRIPELLAIMQRMNHLRRLGIGIGKWVHLQELARGAGNSSKSIAEIVQEDPEAVNLLTNRNFEIALRQAVLAREMLEGEDSTNNEVQSLREQLDAVRTGRRIRMIGIAVSNMQSLHAVVLQNPELLDRYSTQALDDLEKDFLQEGDTEAARQVSQVRNTLNSNRLKWQSEIDQRPTSILDLSMELGASVTLSELMNLLFASNKNPEAIIESLKPEYMHPNARTNPEAQRIGNLITKAIELFQNLKSGAITVANFIGVDVDNLLLLSFQVLDDEVIGILPLLSFWAESNGYKQIKSQATDLFVSLKKLADKRPMHSQSTFQAFMTLLNNAESSASSLLNTAGEVSQEQSEGVLPFLNELFIQQEKLATRKKSELPEKIIERVHLLYGVPSVVDNTSLGIEWKYIRDANLYRVVQFDQDGAIAGILGFRNNSMFTVYSSLSVKQDCLEELRLVHDLINRKLSAHSDRIDEELRQLFEKQASLFPEHPGYLLEAAKIQLSFRDYFQATQTLAKRVEHDSEDLEARFWMGFALFVLERFDEAIEQWKLLEVLNPKNPWVEASQFNVLVTKELCLTEMYTRIRSRFADSSLKDLLVWHSVEKISEVNRNTVIAIKRYFSGNEIELITKLEKIDNQQELVKEIQKHLESIDQQFLSALGFVIHISADGDLKARLLSLQHLVEDRLPELCAESMIAHLSDTPSSLGSPLLDLILNMTARILKRQLTQELAFRIVASNTFQSYLNDESVSAAGQRILNMPDSFDTKIGYECAILFLKIVEPSDNDRWLAIAFAALSRTSNKLGMNKQAIELGESALRLYGNNPDSRHTHELLGIMYKNEGDLIKAQLHLETAVSYAVQTGDLTRTFSCKANLGNVFKRQKKFEEAIQIFEEALHISSENNFGFQWGIYANIGSLYLMQGDMVKASDTLFEALRISGGYIPAISQILTQIRDWDFPIQTDKLHLLVPYYYEVLAEEKWKNFSNTSILLALDFAHVLTALNNYDEAKTVLQIAWKKSLQDSEFTIEKLAILENLARIHLIQRDTRQAYLISLQALEVLRGITKDNPRVLSIEQLTQMLRDFHEPQAAQYSQESLRGLAIEVQNAENTLLKVLQGMELRSKSARQVWLFLLHVKLASYLSGLADIGRSLGKEQSLEYAKEAFAIAQNLDYPEILAIASLDLSAALYANGAVQEALDATRKCIAYTDDCLDSAFKRSTRRTATQNYMNLFLLNLRRLDGLRQILETAGLSADIVVDLSAEEIQEHLVATTMQISQDAGRVAREALDAFEHEKHEVNASACFNFVNYANVLFEATTHMVDEQQVKQYLDQCEQILFYCLNQLKNISEPSGFVQLQTYWILSKYYLTLENYDQAVEYCKLILGNSGMEDALTLQASSLALYSEWGAPEVYQRLEHLAWIAGKYEEALGYAERAAICKNAQLFQTNAIRRNLVESHQIPQEMWQREQQLVEELSSIRKSSSESNSGVDRTATDVLFSLRNLYLEMERINPSYARLVRGEPITLARIRELLDDSSILMFFSFSISSTKEISIKTYIIGKRYFEAVDNRMSVGKYASAENRFEREILEFNRYGDIGETWLDVSEDILGPLQKYIVRGSKVYIVQSGDIRSRLPIHAMQIHEGRFAEICTVSYLPTATFLDYMNREKAIRNIRLETSLVGITFKEEIQRLAELLKAKHIVGDSITKTAFRSILSGSGLLHVSCHGVPNSKTPWDAGLLICEDSGSLDPEHILTAREIADWTCNTSFVNLSACYSAGAGDGVPTLARAFLEAGAMSVLATMWAINDDAAQEFMKEFYTNLVSPSQPSVVEALHSAQFAFINSKRFGHTFFWASFVLFGNLGI